MSMIIIHVDDNIHDLELASLAFAEIDPTITYIPIDEESLVTELTAIAEKEETPLPALVISDMIMPQMSAVQVIELMRGNDRLREVPVAILTDAAPRFDDAEHGIPDHVPLLIKPSQYGDLVILLRELVKRISDGRSGDSAA